MKPRQDQSSQNTVTSTTCTAVIMTKSGISIHTHAQILMNNFKTLLLPSCTKAKVTPIIFSTAAVLQPQNDCFSLHYLCARLTGRWVERQWMGSGRVGNHGTVCHSACLFAVLFVVSASEMVKAGETWLGLI